MDLISHTKTDVCIYKETTERNNAAQVSSWPQVQSSITVHCIGVTDSKGLGLCSLTSMAKLPLTLKLQEQRSSGQSSMQEGKQWPTYFVVAAAVCMHTSITNGGKDCMP